MVRIVKTEFYKLKRYHILWAKIAAYASLCFADVIYIYGK